MITWIWDKLLRVNVLLFRMILIFNVKIACNVDSGVIIGNGCRCNLMINARMMFTSASNARERKCSWSRNCIFSIASTNILFQFRWLGGYIHSSYYYHHQTIIIFFRSCVPEMFVTSYSILSLIAYTCRETGILFSLLLCSLWWVQIFGYVLACKSCSSVCTLHHLITIIVQTYLRTLNLNKMPVRYILSSEWD